MLSAHESTPLLEPRSPGIRRLNHQQEEEASSIVDSHVSKGEKALASSSVGERLPYDNYTTIDWLHDLIKDSYRYRRVQHSKGFRSKVYAFFDSISGWLAVIVIGSLTACVAFMVDVAEATVSDWKFGYCKRNPFMDFEACCNNKTPAIGIPRNRRAIASVTEDCADWNAWSPDWWKSFGIYGGLALAFGVISASLTMLTKTALPAAAPGTGNKFQDPRAPQAPKASAKSMFMAAGSGIPELKTVLSGFVIPNFLSIKVLVIKAVGAVFAVSTGMCLGKEGPFVHISGCVGYLVLTRIPKYRDNGRKLRELLAAAVASGLSVAFGAPIGGVLFSYEEISTYFPRPTLWRAFLCSMFAAIVLKELNPTGTGKLVLFETNYGTTYKAYHYFIFVLLGIAGGVWGGLFCMLNFKWSKWFRSYSLIKNYPILEVFLVVLVTVLLQYPNQLTRDPGDRIIQNLLANCETLRDSSDSFVCQSEARPPSERGGYTGWLICGCLVKLVLTIVTFGAKVPSGIIIPALDAGALFGRLIGQWVGGISPGIFAMVGAGAFLAGVSRMTISLCVIMFELTGELEYVVPHMIAILTAKLVADSISTQGVYDLAQTVLGHPFLDLDAALRRVQRQQPAHLLRRLVPPAQTMQEITVDVDVDNKVPCRVLERKLDRLRERGLMDAGLALVQGGRLQGYLAQGELEFGLERVGSVYGSDVRVRLLGEHVEELDGLNDAQAPHGDVEAPGQALPDGGAGDLNLAGFVDRTPMTMCESAPMEYAVEAFGKLGLRHLMVTEEGTGRLTGVVIKKRLVQYLDGLD